VDTDLVFKGRFVRILFLLCLTIKPRYNKPTTEPSTLLLGYGPYMAQAETKHRFLRFNGTRFGQWKWHITCVLRAEELLSVVDGTEARPNGNNAAAWDRKDWKAMSIISNSLDLANQVYIQGAQTSKEAFDKLVAEFEQEGLASLVYLRKQLNNLKMEEGDNLREHIMALEELAMEIKGLGCTIEDKELSTILILSLPPSWEAKADSLQSQKDIKFQEIKQQLLLYAKKMAVTTHADDNKAFNASTRGMHQASSSRHGKPYRGGRSKQYYNKKGYNHAKSKKHCYVCGKTNHIARDCYHGYGKGKQPASSDNNAAFVSALGADADGGRDCWYVDSGASMHMSCRRDWYHQFESIKPLDIHFSDNTVVQAVGKGSMVMQMQLPNGESIRGTLSDVLYIPTFKRNLFSSTHAVDCGVKVLLTPQSCQI